MVQRAVAMKSAVNPLPFPTATTSTLLTTPKRFEGSYVFYKNYAEGAMPSDGKRGDVHLDESEIVTRMMYVLKEFGIYDLEKLDWKTKWDDQGIDSLE